MIYTDCLTNTLGHAYVCFTNTLE